MPHCFNLRRFVAVRFITAVYTMLARTVNQRSPTGWIRHLQRIHLHVPIAHFQYWQIQRHSLAKVTTLRPTRR